MMMTRADRLMTGGARQHRSQVDKYDEWDWLDSKTDKVCDWFFSHLLSFTVLLSECHMFHSDLKSRSSLLKFLWHFLLEVCVTHMVNACFGVNSHSKAQPHPAHYVLILIPRGNAFLLFSCKPCNWMTVIFTFYSSITSFHPVCLLLFTSVPGNEDKNLDVARLKHQGAEENHSETSLGFGDFLWSLK